MTRRNFSRHVRGAALARHFHELAFAQAAKPRHLPFGELPGTQLHQFDRLRQIALAVHAYGIAARSLALTTAYCRERETFGKPLIANQVVQHKLVDMHRRVEAARTYTREVAARHVAGETVIAEACLAKQTAVEACDHVVDQAVQLHGGTGYMRGTEVEMHYRDARILGIGGGANEVLDDLAAKLLGYWVESPSRSAR